MPDRRNWWAVQISVPQSIGFICALLYDHLNPNQRQKLGQTATIQAGGLDLKSLRGANRAWVSRVYVMAGICLDDGQVLKKGISGLSAVGKNKQNSLFQYALPGHEGIYEDGSYLSHDVYPYTGRLC